MPAPGVLTRPDASLRIPVPHHFSGSHWETRIMRDDVMSYGMLDTVSPITIAAMEDLGHYLGNYTAAGCMSWGYRQGCDFVTSRCGIGRHDRSAPATSADECKGNSKWQTYTDDYLDAKCVYGISPCSTTGASGYVDGAGACDAQCFQYDASGREDCRTAPKSAVTAASLEGVLEEMRDTLQNASWQVWLVLASWGFFILVLLVYILQCICPRKVCKCCPHGALPGQCLCPVSKTARYIVYTLGSLSFLIGLALCSACVYAIVLYEQVAMEFIGERTLWIGVGVSGGVALLSLCVILAVCGKCTAAILPLFWLLMLLAIVQVLVCLLLVYWIYSLNGISFDLISELVGESAQTHAEGWISSILSTPLAVIEGFTCTSYVQCCRDPALGIGNLTQCSQAHEGKLDVTETMLDPSSPSFCAYLTGAPRATLVSPPAGVCSLLDSIVEDLDLAQCQASFCVSGVDGHISFVNKVVAMVKRFAIPLGAGLAVLLLVQVVYACNVRSMRHYIIDKRKKNGQYKGKAPPPAPTLQGQIGQQSSVILGV